MNHRGLLYSITMNDMKAMNRLALSFTREKTLGSEGMPLGTVRQSCETTHLIQSGARIRMGSF
jgi:hypothetical protein